LAGRGPYRSEVLAIASPQGLATPLDLGEFRSGHLAEAQAHDLNARPRLPVDSQEGRPIRSRGMSARLVIGSLPRPDRVDRGSNRPRSPRVVAANGAPVPDVREPRQARL